MTKVYAATALNFFFPGAGYLVLKHNPLIALFFLAGVIGLTWVEFSIQEPLPTSWAVMFASVFVMNIGFAIDAFRVGKAQVAAA